MLIVLFFFFKQKTAYEMRISDWSSDVCSSDLFLAAPPRPAKAQHQRDDRQRDVGVRVWARRRLDVERVQETGRHCDDHAPAGDDDAGARRDRRAHALEAEDEQKRREEIARVDDQRRSEERRVGTGGGSTCRSRWSTYP